ncbi:MAG: hypothetical protein AAGF77_10455 [Bacteroidota bacterium]
MKKKHFIIAILGLVILSACNDSDDVPADQQEYLIAVPLTTDLMVFKEEAVEVMEPTEILQSGKIYAYDDYIFINDIGRGLHVINNTNPGTPVRERFIKLEGNNDISIKNNRLYADSYGDLIIMDITNLDNIGEVKRLENAIYQDYGFIMDFTLPMPEVDAVDYSNFNASTEAIVGWETKSVRMTESAFAEQYGFANTDDFAQTTDEAFSSDASTGQGGSLARFRIVGDYLYVAEWSSINVFDISDLDTPKVLDEVYTDWGIETIFSQGDLLFLGGMQGMYIYDIANPAKPEFVSDFEHGTACDPVVVDGDYAYVTLRGGNLCGAVESGLFIIDISDIKNPTLEVMYPMEDPYGLGVKGDQLFICDGNAGLKVYDKSNVPNLPQLNHFADIVTYDVIPLAQNLLMIGEGVLYQYEYLDDGLRLLSQIQLN